MSLVDWKQLVYTLCSSMLVWMSVPNRKVWKTHVCYFCIWNGCWQTKCKACHPPQCSIGLRKLRVGVWACRQRWPGCTLLHLFQVWRQKKSIYTTSYSFPTMMVSWFVWVDWMALWNIASALETTDSWLFWWSRRLWQYLQPVLWHLFWRQKFTAYWPWWRCHQGCELFGISAAGPP